MAPSSSLGGRGCGPSWLGFLSYLHALPPPPTHRLSKEPPAIKILRPDTNLLGGRVSCLLSAVNWGCS
eukprot:222264-Chlamydomonas_euryale.AAC.2